MLKKGRKVRSIRGVEVDFDLMDIKNQMQTQPKSMEVKAREDYIEQRLKRRAKRRVEQMQKIANEEATQKMPEEEVALTKEIEETKKEVPVVSSDDKPEVPVDSAVAAEPKPEVRRIVKTTMGDEDET